MERYALPARELTIFGDWLLFDEQPIASIAHLPAGVRMLLAEYIDAAGPAIEEAEETRKIDIRKLTDAAVKVLKDEGTDYIVGQYFPGPALPHDYTVHTVVDFQKVKDLLTDDEGFELEGDDE
jgi:hypothetical protein